MTTAMIRALNKGHNSDVVVMDTVMVTVVVLVIPRELSHKQAPQWYAQLLG
jgi:hypothetical protein